MPEVAVCTSRWLTIDRLSQFSRSSNASEPKPQALSNKNFRLNRSMVIKLFATYVGSKIEAETMRNGSRDSNLIQSIKTNSLKLKPIHAVGQIPPWSTTLIQSEIDLVIAELPFGFSPIGLLIPIQFSQQIFWTSPN